MKKVIIYTDGGCSPNPGPGAYCAILTYKEHKSIVKGYKENSTNNEMELTGPIEALKKLKEPCDVEIYCDSQYVVNSMNTWVHSWKKKGWRKSDNKPILNLSLIQELYKYVYESGHQVKFIWVKGHNGNELNEECDLICSNLIKSKGV